MALTSPRLLSPLLVLLSSLALLGPPLAPAQCSFTAQSSGDAVTYSFAVSQSNPGPSAPESLLRITMSFPATPGVPVALNTPSPFISDLHVLTPGATLILNPSGTAHVTSSQSGPITLTYLLHNGWAGPLVHPHEFQPVLRPPYIEITGDKALLWLERDRNKTVTTNLDWQNLPPTWSLATSFGTADPLTGQPAAAPASALSTRCQTVTGPWSRINEALFAAGDFRLHPFHIGQQPAVLAVRGTWTFSDDHAAEQIGKTIRLVRDFWHDDAFPYFLVTLQPFDQDHGRSDGTAYTDAFWMYVSRLDTLDGLLTQLAHEAFHAWNPLKMGDLSPSEYEKTKWFKEGFTEYYAQRLTFQGGERIAQQLVHTTNQDLLAFPTSNSEYTRGRIIALWLDAAIRTRSHGRSSLDNVMFQLVHDRAQPLTEARIYRTIQPFLSHRQLATLREAADQHGNLPAPAHIPGLGSCYHVVRENLQAFDLGFDFSTSREHHALAGVDPSGPAYKAGLRDGEPVLHYDFSSGEPGRQANITVQRDSRPAVVSYLPAGEPSPTWHYVPDAGLNCPALP